MPGIPRDVAKHSLDIRAGARSVSQPLRLGHQGRVSLALAEPDPPSGATPAGRGLHPPGQRLWRRPFRKLLDGLVKGGLKLCKQPEEIPQAQAKETDKKKEPGRTKTYLRLGHDAPRPRPGPRLSQPQGSRLGFRPRQPGPEIGPVPRRPGRAPIAAVAPPHALLPPRLSGRRRAAGGPPPWHPAEKGAW
jgi:hypothetical protein